MAEFQEVMQQLHRMCLSYPHCDDGDGCPIYDACGNIGHRSSFPELSAKIEKNVKAWTAEHPERHEPTYPTWIEWFKQQNIWRKETDNPALNLYSSIPADIARQLGIEPKEDV